MRPVAAVVLALMLALVGCGADAVTGLQGGHARPCTGIRLPSPSSEPTILSVKEDVTFALPITVDDPAIVIPDDPSLITTRTLTKHATTFGSSGRAYPQSGPKNVASVFFLLRGATPGADTAVVRTTLKGANCPDGAELRIPITVKP